MNACLLALMSLLCLGTGPSGAKPTVLDIPLTVGRGALQAPGGVRYSKTFTLPALSVWGFVARSRSVATDSLIPVATFHYAKETQVWLREGRYDLTRDALLLLECATPDSAAVVGEIGLVEGAYRVIQPLPGIPKALRVHIQGDQPATPQRE